MSQEIKTLFERMLDKQDEFGRDISEIKETLVRQEEQLREHMRRSLANEKAVELLADEFKPVQKHVLNMQGALKLFVVIGIVAGAIAALLSLINHLN